MRAIVTGQVGMDKKEYLRRVADFAGEQGEPVTLFNVGDIMYAEAKDVRPGRILDLPWSRLSSLRRAAFKDVIADSRGLKNILVNTHATFRWRHGLFSAFDLDQIALLDPEVFICLVDNIEVVHHRLHRDHDTDATLKDCMVWREEEILATEIIAQAFHKPFYIVSRGRHQMTTRTCFRLACRGDMKRVYPSFPMSHVVDMPDVLAEIDGFRAKLAEHFITFDPGDVDEKLLLDRAIAAVREGKEWLEVAPHQFGGSMAGGTGLQPGSSGGLSAAAPADTGFKPVPPGPDAGFKPVPPQGFRSVPPEPPIKVRVREVLDIAGDIDGQIYMRDFKLIDQSDMIVSYVPELPGKDGKKIPGLSSGVERELQHAFEHAKEVYVVWKPAKAPSPFITETSTRIFSSTEEALSYFENEGMFGARNLFGH